MESQRALNADDVRYRRLVEALIDSNVIGLNEDGSVWVFGGLAADGTRNYTYGGKQAVAPVWHKGEAWAATDSPCAEAIRALLNDGTADA